MNSLYHALLVQHPKQLTPVRCAEHTIAQLHRYFEDVVLENNLSALVIESLPPVAERQLRELARVRELGRQAQAAFIFVSPEDALNRLPLRVNSQDREPKLLQSSGPEQLAERFVVIADARFSALLASVKSTGEGGKHVGGDEVIWTFEPDVVYTSLEYLMARVSAERPLQSADFIAAVSASMPKATSLQLTVSVTSKLARMLQEQAGRETAVNRVATAIRNSLDIDDIVQTTVDEVGRALGALHCALSVNGEAGGAKTTKIYYRDHETGPAAEGQIMADLEAYGVRLALHLQNHVMDGRVNGGDGVASQVQPLAVVPLIYQARSMGALLVRSDDPTRNWQETELLLLRTVADQVIMAVNHARLFAASQEQALTDVLTGCFNRRSFEQQLEREMRVSRRDNQPLSLIMCDLDQFKRVNDTYGHDAGDLALRLVGEKLREELRGRDTAARYGGEEFAIILPQSDGAGALIVAERLREQLSKLKVPGIGMITASFGLASFPTPCESREQLVGAADRALYDAKHQGRNRVAYSPDQPVKGTPVAEPTPAEAVPGAAALPLAEGGTAADAESDADKPKRAPRKRKSTKPAKVTKLESNVQDETEPADRLPS